MVEKGDENNKKKTEWKLRESKFYKENYGQLMTIGVLLELNWFHKYLYSMVFSVHFPVIVYSGYLLLGENLSDAVECMFFSVFYFLANFGSHMLKKAVLTEIIRMLDRKLDDYGNTLDPETADMITKGQKFYQERKHLRVKLMLYALNGAVATLLILKPIFESIIRPNDIDVFENNINRMLPVKLWYFLDVRSIEAQIIMWIAFYYGIIQALFMTTGAAVAYMVISEELCSNIFGLNLALRHLIRRASFMGDGKVDKSNLNECFKRCAIHHQTIIRCFALFQEYFRWVIWLILTICTYQICVSLLFLTLESTETMKIGIGVRLVAFTFLVGQVLYLFFFCLYGEEIEGMSSEIYYAAYEMDWFDYAIEMKQNLQILRIRALNPLKLSCGGLFFANFDTFSNIMNGAYSYFSLIKASINNKD